MAQIIALEARAKHEEAVRLGSRARYTGLDMWSPNINIFRDPRWGRGQETYGEDPYLTGRFAIAFVKGLQGNDPYYFQTIATSKHYAVHSGIEMERHRFDVHPSEQDLRTTYLPAFEASVREGHVFSIMSAYNSVNGLPCSANPRLLTDILRKEWGFEGYVTSDVDAVADVWQNHQFADTPEQAAASSVKAGCDLNGGETYKALTAAVKAGYLSENDIDRALTRLLTARFRLGMFDPPDMVPYAGVPYSLNDTPQSDERAYQASRESIVLLKNHGGTLPLNKNMVHNIAVIGPTADSVPMLLGNYNGTPSHPVTIAQGLRNAVGFWGRVNYVQGCPILTEQLPLEEVVPAQCLFTDASRATPGLTADYFRDVALGGHTARARIDLTIDFTWGVQAIKDPLPPLPPSTQPSLVTATTQPSLVGMSARWTGLIVPPESGVYELGINAGGGFRMWVDGKLLLTDWNPGAKRSVARQISLKKDTPAQIVVEYYRPVPERRTEDTGNAGIQLRWTRPTADGEASMGGGLPLFADAIRAAQNADAIVMVLGITADQEREEHVISVEGFEGGDRTSLDLPGVQEDMLEAVMESAGNKPVILVLTSGSALSVNWAKEHVPAILEAWYPGQRGGDALADVLFGNYNPAGRLPVTFYKSVTDLAPFTDYNMHAGPGRTYRYFTGEPLWPFGYGLSYTSFDYTNVKAPTTVPTTENVTISTEVKNTGKRDGDEVVQLYLVRDAGPDGLPLKTLAGFQRVSLKAGETKTVEFTLTPQQLSTVDKTGKRSVQPGPLTLQVGPNSATGTKQPLTLTGAAVVPEYRFVAPVVK
jgi:beta-glucosidase